MEQLGKWQLVRELGEGGQGRVFLARDTTRVNLEADSAILAQTLNKLTGISMPRQIPLDAQKLHDLLRRFDLANDPQVLGALKRLHKPKDTVGYEKAKERMGR